MYMTVLKMDFNSLLNRSYYMNIDSGEFMHKWLTSQFDCERRDLNILYRVDKTENGVYIYIQSDSEMPEKNITNAGLSLIKKFNTEIGIDDNVMFSVRCLPMLHDKEKALYIKSHEQRIEYVKNRLSACMYVEDVKEGNIGTYFIKNNHRITGSDFFGIGKITDIELFNNIVRKGIGKCKCYGMGLLLFKKV